MSRITDLTAQVEALKAELAATKAQPVVVRYIDRVVEVAGKMPRKQEVINLLCTAESVHKNTLVSKTGMSGKNVDSQICYLRKDGWVINLDNSRYSFGDCAFFRRMAAMPNAPEWMQMRLELIVAREEIENTIKAKYAAKA